MPSILSERREKQGSRAGFSIVTSENIEILSWIQKPFTNAPLRPTQNSDNLVILNMNMPGLGGIGTLPRLRALRPEVPVLLATGRVDQTALTLASAHPGVTLMPKPFGLRELQKHLESLGLG